MNIYDFNIHLPLLQKQDVNEVIGEDLHMNVSDLNKALIAHLPKIKDNKGANFMLFNTKLFDEAEKFPAFNESVSDAFSSYSYTALIDFRDPGIFKYMEVVKFHKVKFVMFNSYLQKITDEDFPLVYEVCKYAQDHEINICIDASYGTSKMYTYDNLKLACYIADRINRVPIVIIHSGGKRVLDAMLLAADKQNVYLDTSFSLPYYLGSSIETDMAFAYKNIGTHKVVYGSDFPYLNSEKSFDIHMDFFRKFYFSDSDIERIMYKNALALLNND
jgi:uncharacterized protein